VLDRRGFERIASRAGTILTHDHAPMTLRATVLVVDRLKFGVL